MCDLPKKLIQFLLVFSTFAFALAQTGAVLKCEPLTPPENVEISCTYSSTTNNCKDRQLPGTIAKLNCKPFYIPFNKGIISSLDQLKCARNGTWTHFEKFEAFSCYEDCGKRLVNPKPLIIHGIATNRTSWPWHVSIFKKFGSKFGYICGGTLIRNGIVLTAAHCVASSDGIGLNPLYYKILVGAVSSNYSANRVVEGMQEFEVRKIYVSQNYDVKKDFNADIAILHLRGQMQYNEHVLPVCLPNDYAVDLNAIKPGKLADIVGFGVDETGHASSILKHVALQIKSNTECFNSLKQTLTESQFCAGNHAEDGNFTTVCNGDSGGGLVYPSSVLGKYHIHGIVSTGDGGNNKVCQNYGVFTRVFQFMGWIRDILEDISGNVIRELAYNVKYPFELRGIVRENGEIRQARFLGIPREWDLRIYTIELVYVDMDPVVLLENLENTKTIQFINLTQVNLDSMHISKRVRLPYIKSFVLDILKDSFDVQPNRQFPFTITKEFIKSLLFFDKDYDEHPTTWSLEQIVHLKTEVELTINIFKLLSITSGRISASQLPFFNEIMGNLPSLPDFKLEHLAVNQADNFNPEQLLKYRNTLEYLILNNVTFTQEPADLDLGQVLRFLKNLKELRLVAGPNRKPSVFFLNQLPQPLKQLAFVGTELRINYSDPNASKSLKSKIRFHFPNLETFTCDFCELDRKIVENFHWIFKNVRRLVLITSQPVNIKRLVDRMENLEWILISNRKKVGKNDLDSIESVSNFYGLNQFGNFHSLDRNESDHGFILEKASGPWTIRSASLDDSRRMEFKEHGLANFWTSPAEYEILARLAPNELIAKQTGHFRFNGSTANPEELLPIKTIPKLLQPYIKSIHISNSDVIPEVMAFSIRHCKNLESFVMTDVKLHGLFDNRLLELPKVKEYKMSRVLFSHLSPSPWDYIKDIDDVLYRSSFPFEEFLKNGQFLDYASRFYESAHLDSVDLSYDGCQIIFTNRTSGVLISTLRFTNYILEDFKLSEKTYPMKKLAIRGQILGNVSEIIPSTVTQLNLDQVNLVENAEVSKLLGQRLTMLTDLRLVDSYIGDYPNFVEVNLADFKSHTSTMQFLEFGKVSVTNTPNIEFGTQLKLAHFDSCQFDEGIATNFSIIFPAVNLVLKNAETDEAAVSRYEDILLNILENETGNTKWIFVNLEHLSTITISITKESGTRKRLEAILKAAEVPLNEIRHFVVAKNNRGKWVWVESESRKALSDLEFLYQDEKSTGADDFGRNGCGPNMQHSRLNGIKKTIPL